jgi:hypothetical protein
MIFMKKKKILKKDLKIEVGCGIGLLQAAVLCRDPNTSYQDLLNCLTPKTEKTKND